MEQTYLLQENAKMIIGKRHQNITKCIQPKKRKNLPCSFMIEGSLVCVLSSEEFILYGTLHETKVEGMVAV